MALTGQTMARVAILVFLYGVLQLTDAAESIKWSNSYSLKATLTVPAANISEPYQVWLNGNTGHSRVDFYDGMDKLYREWSNMEKTYKYYKIHPQTTKKYTNKETCTEVLASATETKMYVQNTYLPVKPWSYIEPEIINGIAVHKYIYVHSITIANIIANVSYSVWVRHKYTGYGAHPVRYVFEMKTAGRIIDHFRHDYSYFEETTPSPYDIIKPVGMNCVKLTEETFDTAIDPLAEYIDPFLEHSRVEKAFGKFKKKYDKIYTDEKEHFKRISIFKDNLRFINSFNRKHGSTKVGVNHFADFSVTELHSLMGTIILPKEKDIEEDRGDDDNDNDADIIYDNNIGDKQANFDWRDYAAITPVKEQTPFCGACYAFTAAAAIESSAYVARGCKFEVNELSEQALIDCSWGQNQGCNGGQLEYTLQWVLDHGMPSKKEYGGYLAMEGLCHITNMTILYKPNSYDRVKKKKQLIKKHLRAYGPLLAAIDSKPLSFLFHTGSSIYKDESCSSDPLEVTHGVTIVGYGKEDGEDYWIVKNSFGSDWGDGGYAKIATQNNICGVKNFVYYVIFKKNFSEFCKPKNL